MYWHFKARSNPSGKNPADDWRDCIKQYHTVFNTFVGPEILLDLPTQYANLPYHMMLEHVGDWIHMLWEDYEIIYGDLSLELAENYNKVICTFLETRSNRHSQRLSIQEESEHIQPHDNRFFQAFRHFLVQIFCFAESLTQPIRKRKCSACGAANHHNRNNQYKCPKHPKYKEAYSIMYDSSNDTGDENDECVKEPEQDD
jgi:hypothetical protein